MNKRWADAHPERARAARAAWREKNRDKCRGYALRYWAKNRAYALWRLAKQRATRDNRPFDLEISDVKIPEICPLLGIRLEHGKRGFHAASPSLDCILPSRGYTRGNVWVISFRANAIKRDASPEELIQIGRALEQQIRGT